MDRDGAREPHRGRLELPKPLRHMVWALGSLVLAFGVVEGVNSLPEADRYGWVDDAANVFVWSAIVITAVSMGLAIRGGLRDKRLNDAIKHEILELGEGKPDKD